MKKQILVIGGGNAFDTYDEYIEDLKSRDISLERLLQVGWKKKLQENLGGKYLVINAQMPNTQNARYLEWKIWFERIVSLLDEQIILLGHSLGGIFLAKYLSEGKISKKVDGLFLIASPYCTESNHPLVDFNISKDLNGITEQVGKIFTYHSKDDYVVPFSNFEMYQKQLPTAVSRIFEDKQHFNQEEFPEIVQDIINLN